MAKAPVKPAKKTSTSTSSASTSKSSTSTSKSKSQLPAADRLEGACIDALKKLQTLGIEQQLQSDIEWCLGSFRHDKNTSGLQEMLNRTVAVFKSEQSKKTKGITAKAITDLENALKE